MKLTVDKSGSTRYFSAKLSQKEHFDPREIDILASNMISALIPPASVQGHQNNIMRFDISPYTATLEYYLSFTLTCEQFSQILLACISLFQQIQQNHMNYKNVVLDLDKIYIQLGDRSLHFVYLPLMNSSREGSLPEFFQRMIARTSRSTYELSHLLDECASWLNRPALFSLAEFSAFVRQHIYAASSPSMPELGSLRSQSSPFYGSPPFNASRQSSSASPSVAFPGAISDFSDTGDLTVSLRRTPQVPSADEKYPIANGQYEVGSTVFNNWTIISVIGEGSFGRVFEIQRRDDFTTEHSALKVITVPKSSAELRSLIENGKTPEQAKRYLYGIVENIVSEIKIMSKLKATANIVSYEDHQIVSHPNGMGWDILIRMELLHPLLFHVCQHPLSMLDIVKLGADMCKALELCQKHNIVHRDIKPENIFISDNGDYKLGDFGIARTIERSNADLTKTGTYNYMAPEVYRGENYDFRVDIYSLGIVLYKLLNKNRLPFLPLPPAEVFPKDQEQSIARRMGGEAVPLPFYFHAGLSEIVLKACSPSASDRYSSPSEMRQALESLPTGTLTPAQIYPDADTLEAMRSFYPSRRESYQDKDRILPPPASKCSDNAAQALNVTSPPAPPSSKSRSRFNPKLFFPIFAVCLVAVCIGGFFLLQHSWQAGQQNTQGQIAYQSLIDKGLSVMESDPKEAMEYLIRAQSVHPEEGMPFVAYAHALYLDGDYDHCVYYIETVLELGKNYSSEDRAELKQILNAARSKAVPPSAP